nr:uncharacterized protein LOC124812217 [Hydra vulgaris]
MKSIFGTVILLCLCVQNVFTLICYTEYPSKTEVCESNHKCQVHLLYERKSINESFGSPNIIRKCAREEECQISNMDKDNCIPSSMEKNCITCCNQDKCNTQYTVSGDKIVSSSKVIISLTFLVYYVFQTL